MNLALPLAALFLCLGIVGCDASSDEPPRVLKQAVVRGNNTFGFDLYHQLQSQDGNLFFSPYSISTALSMTYAGARGQTAQEMAHVLHLSPHQDQLHPAIASVVGGLAGQADGVRLDVANALWGQKGQPFVPEFLQLTKKYYGAGFREVDFRQPEAARQEINTWVEQQTQEKIKDLIGPNVLNNATLVLTNAIYFGSLGTRLFQSEQFKEDFSPAQPKSSCRHDLIDREAQLPGRRSLPDDLSLYKGDAASFYRFLPLVDGPALGPGQH